MTDFFDAAFDVERLLDLIATDPQAGADELDRMADALHDAAVALRTAPPVQYVPENEDRPDTCSEGGFSDRVMARVVGPNGETKQYTDSKGR